jgi:hypothetical protein
MHYRGHPNRKLTGVTLPAAEEELRVGSELFLGEAAMGALTSLARLAREGRRKGIAMLRYREIQDGPRLALRPGGEAEVELWPLASDLGISKA